MLQRLAPVVRIKGHLVVLRTKLFGVVEVRGVTERLTGVAIETDVMPEVVALEDPVMLNHPVVGCRNHRLQNRSGYIGMVHRSEVVTDVMDQSTQHILVVLAGPQRPGSSLEAMLKAIDRKASVIVTKEFQLLNDPVRNNGLSLFDRNHDLGPVLCSGLLETGERGFAGSDIGHVSSPLDVLKWKHNRCAGADPSGAGPATMTCDAHQVMTSAHTLTEGRRLAGKVAIVTGGAGGIGAATVDLFVAEGAKVLVVDLDAERAAVVADRHGAAAAGFGCDVSQEEQVAAMVAEAIDLFGRLDVLFNNAGFGGALGPIAQTPVEDFDLTFDVLVKSVFLGIKHAAPILMAQGSGSVINTASVAALRAGWSPHLYAAAKAAVVHLSHSAALELASAQVRCNSICPGFIATPLAYGRPDATADQLSQMKRDAASTQPIGRVGEPSDIAAMALFLASEESAWITGQDFVVDGGAAAGPPWAEFPAAFTTYRPIRHHRPPQR